MRLYSLQIEKKTFKARINQVFFCFHVSEQAEKFHLHEKRCFLVSKLDRASRIIQLHGVKVYGSEKFQRLLFLYQEENKLPLLGSEERYSSILKVEMRLYSLQTEKKTFKARINQVFFCFHVSEQAEKFHLYENRCFLVPNLDRAFQLVQVHEVKFC
jgi:hypothetical protein